MYIACLMGNSSLARSLISSSDWRIFCHEQKQPPLFAAVVNDDVNTVSVLLDCGVDVDQVDADGRSALSLAAKLGHVQMCKTLILHGANVNSRYDPLLFLFANYYILTLKSLHVRCVVDQLEVSLLDIILTLMLKILYMRGV